MVWVLAMPKKINYTVETFLCSGYFRGFSTAIDCAMFKQCTLMRHR